MRRRDKLTPIIHVQDIRSARDGGGGEVRGYGERSARAAVSKHVPSRT